MADDNNNEGFRNGNQGPVMSDAAYFNITLMRQLLIVLLSDLSGSIASEAGSTTDDGLNPDTPDPNKKIDTMHTINQICDLMATIAPTVASDALKLKFTESEISRIGG